MILEKHNEDEKMSDCLINPKQIDRVDIFRNRIWYMVVVEIEISRL